MERTLAAVDGLYKHVNHHGLFGTYDDGLAWLKRSAGKPKWIMWMGSSIGSLDRTEVEAAVVAEPKTIRRYHRGVVPSENVHKSEGPRLRSLTEVSTVEIRMPPPGFICS